MSLAAPVIGTDPRVWDRLTWAALLLAAGLRLTGLGWDDWQMFHPDEGNLVRAALGLTFPDRLMSEFHAYNGLAVLLPAVLAWAVAGTEATSETVLMAARLISALAGIGVVGLGALVARRLAGPAAGALAAGLLATNAALIQWAHFGTTESALMLAVVALWLLAQRHIDGADGPWRLALGSGAVLGLAFGFKTAALALGALPLAALLLGRQPPIRLAAPVAAGLALALALGALAAPAVLLDHAAWRETMRFEGAVVSGAADVFWTWSFEHARPGRFEAAQLWGLTQGGGLLLALAGLGLAATDPRLRRGVAPGLLFVILYGGVILGWHARFVRYLAPVLPVLLILAALALAWLVDRGRSRSLLALAGVWVAVHATAGLSMASSFLATDPRLAADAHLAARLAPGETVLREPVDIGPPLGRSLARGPLVETLPLIQPESPERTARLAAMVSEGDWLVISSRRHWGVLPRRTAMPSMCGYYAALFEGRLGLEPVARFRRAAFLGPLFHPGPTAEETRVVFDRPEVILYRRTRPIEPAEAERQIAAPAQDCRSLAP